MLAKHLLKKRNKKNSNKDSRYIYQNKLGNACFQHDITYGDFKDLPRRTPDKVLLGKALNIEKKSQNMMVTNVDLLQVFRQNFHKYSSYTNGNCF